MADWPKEVVAVHEAGHAVGSLLLGRAALREVTIVPQDATSGSTSYYGSRGEIRPVERRDCYDELPTDVDLGADQALLDLMVICLAGRAAVIEFGWPEMADAGAGTDLEMVAQIAMGLSDGAFVRAPYMARTLAQSLVRRHREAIGEVAGALLASPTGRLMGDEVRAIMSRYRRAPDPHPTEAPPSPPAQP